MDVYPKTLKARSQMEWRYVGPPVEEGPLPALIYLALSAEDSLLLDPINQPAQIALKLNFRVFSCSLPYHGQGEDPHEAIPKWAKSFLDGIDPFALFLDNLMGDIDDLIAQNMFTVKKLAVAGLSRGGLLASIICARSTQIDYCLGFAPVTDLMRLKEFRSYPELAHQSLVEGYRLSHYVKALSEKNLRFYIGNNDLAVDTDAAYAVIREIAQHSHHAKKRKCVAEFVMKQSIGHRGHGTSPESFAEGIAWIADAIG